jgi:hypothetical protein
MFSCKSVVAAIAMVTMVGSSAFAAATDGALAPGKPAGVQKAEIGTGTLILGIGAAAIIAGIVIVVSNQNANNGTGVVNTAVTTSSGQP